MVKIAKIDWVLFFAVILLLLISLLALYSVSLSDQGLGSLNFKKQAFSGFLGVAGLLFLSFYDYRAFNVYSTKLYFLGLAILGWVIFWGTKVHGTTGWIGLGGFNFQPVELIKLIVVVFLASFLSKKKDQLTTIVRIIASIVLVFIPVFLILCQPDFGSAVIIIGSWLVMLVLSGIDKKNLAFLFLGVVFIVAVGALFLKDYQRDRVSNFFDPTRDPRGSGYNVIQSMVAVGSGGVFGKGIGHGSQSQLNFLPEKHTDFIFAVICEEMGFFGALTVLALFGIIFWRMREIVISSRDNFGYICVMGIMSMLVIQVAINIGMNIGVAPVAGVPLPFLSYGGSSLLSSLAAVGIAQSVYMRRTRNIHSS
jgi:rod shape determining protein RodA